MKKINPKELWAVIRGAILQAAETALSDEEKAAHALDIAAKWVDERVSWHWLGPLAIIAERVDGPAIRRALGLAVEMGYQALKSFGQIPGKDGDAPAA